MAAVGDDREQDVVALLRLPLPRLDRLDALGEIALIGEEGLARRGRDDLASAARDSRQAEILAQVRLQHHVRRHARDRHEVGDVDELAEPGDGLIEAGGLKLEFRPRLPEIGRPGVEFLNAALLQGVGLDEPLQGEELGQRIGDRGAGGGDQRAAGVPRRVDVAGLDIEVPGPLRSVRIDALQRRLVGPERQFSEFLHFVDDQLVDADLGDGQHVVLAAISAARGPPPGPPSSARCACARAGRRRRCARADPNRIASAA